MCEICICDDDFTNMGRYRLKWLFDMRQYSDMRVVNTCIFDELKCLGTKQRAFKNPGMPFGEPTNARSLEMQYILKMRIV